MAGLAIIFHSTYAPKTTGQDQTKESGMGFAFLAIL
jgi:hypothetical protein